jgi:uncharacterized RDD family membrane protein YckC
MPDHGHDATAAAAVDPAVEDARLEEIVAGGPLGAFAVAGVATFIVVAIFVAFYFMFYLPRGMIQ